MVFGRVPSFSNRAKVTSQLRDVVDQAGGQQPAGADQGVAPPIQKPRIPGDDRPALAAPDEKGAGGPEQLLAKHIVGEQRPPGLRESGPGPSNPRFLPGPGRPGRPSAPGWPRAFGQRQLEPAWAESVAAANLPPALLDRVGNVLAPLRLRVIEAGIGKDAQLAVGAGVKAKPLGGSAVRGGRSRRAFVGGSLRRGFAGSGWRFEAKWYSAPPFCLVSLWKFRSSISTRTVRTTSAWARKLFAGGLRRCRAAEMEDRGVALLQHIGRHLDFHGAAIARIGDKVPDCGRAGQNEARLLKSSGEMNPSALTQTRMRLARMWRSTGRLGCRLAPRAQSYFELTAPRSTHSRAMAPRPLVSRTTRSGEETQARRWPLRSPGRKRVATRSATRGPKAEVSGRGARKRTAASTCCSPGRSVRGAYRHRRRPGGAANRQHDRRPPGWTRRCAAGSHRGNPARRGTARHPG